MRSAMGVGVGGRAGVRVCEKRRGAVLIPAAEMRVWDCDEFINADGLK